MGENEKNEPQHATFLPLPLPRQFSHEGRRGSLGSGMVGALLQLQQRHNAQVARENQLGLSFFAEYEQINKETRSRCDINLNRLRDQMRSRSEPCLSFQSHNRRSKSNQAHLRCLSPLTPRRLLQPSPRVSTQAQHQMHQNIKGAGNRRWSIASHPSSGYMTQNSTPPSYSACSSSAEKIYRSDVESINSIEDLRKCSPLSSSFSSHQLQNAKKEIEDRNIVYREKFPNVRRQMEAALTTFIAEEEELEESLQGGDAVWAFIHKQLIEIARLTLKKSEENLITCQVFADNSERCEVLKDEGKQKAGTVNTEVLRAIRAYLKIISRPARLLEYIEFNTAGFISLLDQFEDSARSSEQPKLEPHRYVLKMLGLDVPTAAADQPYVSSDEDSYKQAPIKVTQDDFDRIKLISQGAYAAVYLVKHKETRQRFAMKRIAKSSLQLRNQVQRAFIERDIMTFTENPFVVSMYCSFETINHLCMIMEYVEGGDVRTLLSNIQTLPADMAKMYTAEVVLALEYLHSYGIVHRDLKPDNLLITSVGHIKLTDFGLSKVGLMRRATEIYEEQQDEEDHTKFDDQETAGTPEYLAPEVIYKQEYSTDVDWWALGVIIYEILMGLTPFYADTVDEVFANICKGDVEFLPEEEDDYMDEASRSIVMALLDSDRSSRLSTPEEIKEHVYFAGIEWDNILRQKAQFIPQLNNDEDTSYFDPRADQYHHVSSDDDDCVSIKSSKSEINIDNIGFTTSSNKFNSSFRREEKTTTPTHQQQQLPAKPRTNAAKQIMNHHESKSRLMRDSSCDSITDEVFNRHRISSASSDNDIHFNIGGDSDDEELTLTPTHPHSAHNAGLRRPSNSSGAESDGSSIRDLHRSRSQLPTSPLGNHAQLASLRRSVPKSASTSSIPESRLIIPNNDHHIFSNRDSLLSSEASSRDSSPNRPASPASLGLLGEIRQITIQRSKKDYPGFTVMTIPVYIGSSNNYTLHHLVKNVNQGSQAERAGLKKMDLITHIKGESVQGWLYTEIVTALLDKKMDLTIRVVPLDSTGISLQQCQPRRRGKLVRKRRNQREKRIKHQNRYRSNHKSNELKVPGMESSSGRTSPRPGVPKTMIAKQSGRPSLNIKRPHGRKTPGSRRKSTSHIVPMTKGGPLSPLAQSGPSNMPVSPLARTPSPSHAASSATAASNESNSRLQARHSTGRSLVGETGGICSDSGGGGGSIERNGPLLLSDEFSSKLKTSK